MLQSLSVLADARRVGTTSRLEPINLKILRRTRVMPFSFLVLSAAALWITGLVSSGELRPRLLGLAVIPTGYAVIAVIAWIVAGEEGRWLRIDNEGVTVHGDRIPWEAVISARWEVGAVLTRPRRPGIKLRLRPVDGYQPPRSASVSIDPTLFGMPGIELLDLIVRYAQPHTVYVLPPRHHQ